MLCGFINRRASQVSLCASYGLGLERRSRPSSGSIRSPAQPSKPNNLEPPHQLSTSQEHLDGTTLAICCHWAGQA